MLKTSRKTTKTALKEIKNSAFTCGYTACTAESTMLRDFNGKKKRVTVCKHLSLDLGKNFKFVLYLRKNYCMLLLISILSPTRTLLYILPPYRPRVVACLVHSQ